jgi:hypothetical protein
MTRRLSELFQELVADEPPMRLSVPDVVDRGRRRRSRRRWVATAVLAALLPVPVAGLGVAGALTAGHPMPPGPALPSHAVTPTESVPSPAQATPEPTGKATPGPSRPPAAPDPPAPSAVNELADPGFEATPPGWAVFGRAGATVLTPTRAARSGAQALVITTTLATQASSAGATSNPVRTITRAGATYTASCWVRAPSKVDAILQVQEYTTTWERAGDPMKSTQLFLTDPQRWYQLSLTYRAKQSGNLLPLTVFSSWLSAGNGSLVVDDCALYAGP